MIERFVRIKNKFNLLFPPKAILISFAFGALSFLLISLGVHFYLPGTGALTDPREIINSLGAAFAGPFGAVIIGTLSSLTEPSDDIRLFVICQHIISAVWVGWAYRNLLFNKFKMPTFIFGWIIILFVYYYITYLPGLILAYYYFPNIYTTLVGFNAPLLNGTLSLYQGWIPELIFTMFFTSLVLLALPERIRKPKWGKPLANENKVNLFYLDDLYKKIISKNFIAFRIAIWFVLFTSIPLVFVTIFVQNFYSTNQVNSEINQQLRVAKQIALLISNTGDISYQLYTEDLKRYNARISVMDIDMLVTSKRIDFIETKPYSIKIDQQSLREVLDKDEGYFFYHRKYFVVGFVKVPENKKVVFSISESFYGSKTLIDELSWFLYKNLAVTLFLVSILAGFIAWFIITRPIKKLTNAAYEIGKGNFDQEIDSTEMDDDIKVLATAFDEMKFNINETKSKLVENENKYRLLFEAANDAIFILKKDVYVDVNPKALELFKCSKDSIIGKTPVDFSPEFQADGNSSIEKASKIIKDAYSGSSRIIDWTHKRFDDTLFEAEISIVRIELKEDYYLQAIVRDVTERKKYEAELIKAKEEAEKSSNLKSEFLAQVSHEIRSPLHSILGFIELLEYELKDFLNPTLKKSFDAINVSGKRIVRTVGLILNMSELQVGSYSPKFEKTDLTESILKSVIDEYKLIAESKGIILSFRNFSQNSFVCIDRYSVTQIFVNLIDNAIKFTDSGKVEIILENNSDQKLTATVKDSGIGISKEYLAKIFEPFSQEEQGYNRSFEGNGLGLALVKKYCNLNNAQISLESQKGIGSKFSVTFS